MKKIVSIAVFALILFSGLGVATAIAQSEMLLRWSLKQGDKFDIEMAQQATQELNLGGPQSIETNFTMRMSMTVDAVRENEFDVTQTIDSVKLSMESAFMSFDYDSATGEVPEGQAAMIVEGLKPMVGLSVKQTINHRGETTSVEINEDKLAELEANQIAGQFVSKDSFKQMLSANGLILPEEAISQGDTWTSSFENAASGMKFKTDSTFTLAGTETVDGKELAKITADQTMSTVSDDDAQVAIQLKSQKSEAVFLFDNLAGRLTSATVNQDMEMAVDQGGVQMDISTKSQSKFTLTPAK